MSLIDKKNIDAVLCYLSKFAEDGKMKNISKVLTSFVVAVVLFNVVLSLNGCTKVNSPSLYDPNFKSLAQPVVDSLSPAGSAYAGIDTITVYGKNFSANKDSDGIYFNSTNIYNTGLISASTTKLVVKAPAVSGDSVQIRVWVLGAVDFSATYKYKMIAVVSSFSTKYGIFGSGETAFGITVGKDDSMYVSLSNSNLGTKDEGIYRIGTGGSRAASGFVLPTTSNIDWPAIKFGPDGNIYAVKGNKAIYQLKSGQTNPGGTAWLASFTPAATSFNDIDFDATNNHYMWAVGNNKNIYRVDIDDKSYKAYPFVGNVRSVKCSNDGYLYFAATGGVIGSTTYPEGQVYRAPIVSDSLGTPEVYFDINTVQPVGGNNIYAIALSTDGTMYAGVDSADYMIVVHPGAVVEKRFLPYIASGVLKSPCKCFTWVGPNIYATTAAGEILKIVVNKEGVPYYGIQ